MTLGGRGGGGGGGLENRRPGLGGGNILDVDGQGGGGVGYLKIRQFSWTSYVYRP